MSLIVNTMNVSNNSLTAFFMNSDSVPGADEAHAWALLLAARSAIEAGSADRVLSLQYDRSSGSVEAGADNLVDPDLVFTANYEWQYSTSLSAETRGLLDLYLPVLGTPDSRSVIVGHLGQSVDARIATSDGDAFFVTGEENRKHLHRLRALSHAVIVGVGTVQADNPQLTTRSVSGQSPVRVIIDPSAKVSLDAGLLNDGAATTMLIHAQSECTEALSDGAQYERILLPAAKGRISVNDIVDALASRGMHRLFIEGGGVTVSRFLHANCLHRLHIAAAPLLVGEGRSALQMPGALTMQSALRPAFKLYRMGCDVLWDFDLHDTKESVESPDDDCVQGNQRPSIERLL